MAEIINDFNNTVSEFLEFTGSLMDVLYENKLSEIDGEKIADEGAYAKTYTGDKIIATFCKASEHWILIANKDITLFDKDFNTVLEIKDYNSKDLIYPIVVYRKFKAESKKCPIEDEDVEYCWQYLTSLVKDAIRYVEHIRKTDSKFMPAINIEVQKRTFTI